MKQGSNNFNNLLARGLAFERGEAIIVLHKLYPNYLIMNNQVDPPETTGGKIVGPRLYRGEDREQEFIAPDFVMFDVNGRTSWVDAKLKGAAYTHPSNRKLYFTIDRKKHEQYSNLPSHILHNFWFLIKNDKTENIYLAKYQENPDTLYFDNTYDKGDIPIYYLDDIALQPR